VETDWSAADKLVREVCLDPGHAAAQGVRMLLDDLRRESFLDQSIARVRRDLKGASAEIAQAVSLPG